jgi:GT2 family glycosyltransferase
MLVSLACTVMADLTIIIVSWNCWDYLDGCLRSVQESDTRRPIRVIVVDNGSGDGTPDLVRRRHPWVELLCNSSNVGFAAGNNRAMRVNRSPFVLLLNADTVVVPGALDTMLEFLDKEQDVWATGPAVLSGDRSPQRTGVRFPTNWNLLVETLFLDRLFPGVRLFGQHRELYVDPSISREVDYLQGSCLMVRAEAIQKVGLLDEDFFMYFEETDWCYRMKAAGGRVMTCPSAEVVHYGGGTTGHYDESRLLAYHRSLLHFYRKHYTRARQVGVRAILALRAIVRIIMWGLVAVIKPRLRSAALSSIRGYFRTFPLLLRWKGEAP